MSRISELLTLIKLKKEGYTYEIGEIGGTNGWDISYASSSNHLIQNGYCNRAQCTHPCYHWQIKVRGRAGSYCSFIDYFYKPLEK